VLGVFSFEGIIAYQWASNKEDDTYCYYQAFVYNDPVGYIEGQDAHFGFAVRCFRLTDPGVSTITDYDGNVYDVVQIGSQWWLKQDLKVTHYNDGEAIPNITDDAAWVATSTGAYCTYNNQ
jgi:hypothetical protein